MMLRNFKPRLYQETILHTAVKNNTLVVLPTGMGKTSVALMLAIQRLKQHPSSKILILAPTKPLIDQHYRAFLECMEFPQEKFVLFTGSIAPVKRHEQWKDAQVIFSTPQCVDGDTEIFSSSMGPIKIKDFVESFKLKKSKSGPGYSANIKAKILGLNGQNVKGLSATKAWKRPCNKKYTILTELNNRISCTPEHPLLTISSNGQLSWKRADLFRKGEFVALAEKICLDTKPTQNYKLLRDLAVPESKIKNKVLSSLKKSKWKHLDYGNYYSRHVIPLDKFFAMARKLNLKLPNQLPITDLKGRSSTIKVPEIMNEKLAYIIGAMLGDGHIGNREGHGGEVVLSELNYKDIENLFKAKFKSVFGTELIKDKDKGLIAYSRAAATVLECLGVKSGNKAKSIRVPHYMFLEQKRVIGGFLSGLFNADGDAHKNMIRFASVSEQLIRDLKWLLLKVGIASYIENRPASKSSKIGNRIIASSPCSILIISDSEQIEKFLKLCEDVSKSKTKRLVKQMNETKRQFTRSKRIIPIQAGLREAYKEHRSLGGKVLDEVRVVYSNGYNSKSKIREVLSQLRGNKAKMLQSVLNLPLRWVRVKNIHIQKDKSFVYDLTIKDHHNFVANFLINHNTVENDIMSNKIDIKDVSLLVVDEAHRAVKEYSYVWLAQQYNKKARYPKILALTASPGSDQESITEVCKNLFIEEIEIRTDQDPDVKPYIQDVNVTYDMIPLPEEFTSIQKFLKDCLTSKLKDIQGFGYLRADQVSQPTRRDLLGLQGHLHGDMAKGDRSFELLKSLSLAAEAMKIQHAQELIESQGIKPLHEYMENLFSQAINTKVKATINLSNDLNFRAAAVKVKKLFEAKIEHPKVSRLKDIVLQTIQKKGDAKIIIFSQYRDTVSLVTDELQGLGVAAKLFVGQAKKKATGMSQKDQISLLHEFRLGLFNVLVASSVGEEGLDIPMVDAVIFYEPVPSAIRSIQRRGRTGRLEEGAVTVLVAQGTRDEAYRWSSHHKEKRMYKTLKELQKNFKMTVRKEVTLADYQDKSDLRIFADFREKGSGVLKELLNNNVNLDLQQLQVGDFIVSSRCAIEYKTQDDFVQSIIDGRIMQQIKVLKQHFERPVIIVEGNQDLYSLRNIHANAIRGMLATITLSYGVPVLYTAFPKDSASMLIALAKREQEETSGDFSFHNSKPSVSLKDQQEYVVSSLPGVGGGLAKELLKHFKTVKNIANASEEELKTIEKIGDLKAKKIATVLSEEHRE